MKELWTMFLAFARIGGLTFGGGYAMLPMLQKEVVEKHGWATEEELMDYYAIGQCTPGVIAVNTATFVGKSKAGILGAVVGTLGLVFPSIVIILAIAVFLSNFMHIAWVNHAFNGVRAGVVALILSSVIKLFKSAVKDWVTRIIYIIVLLLAAAGAFLPAPVGVLGAVLGYVTSPVVLVILSGVAGLCIRTVKEGHKK